VAGTHPWPVNSGTRVLPSAVLPGLPILHLNREDVLHILLHLSEWHLTPEFKVSSLSLSLNHKI
jgi:hypothetical protein